ncbi:MAG: hypothetical protein LAO18_14175 [Acidobacteriia bacterium]|nr:hypothetical protein [Terriglobia bacterium]
MADSGLSVAAGFIFQAAVGGPAWTLGMIYYHNVQLISVLLQVVPPLAGLPFVSGMPQIPKAAPAIAWLLHPTSLCASLLWRNEELNVNFSNAVWPPLADFFRLPVFQALLVLTFSGISFWAVGFTGYPVVITGRNLIEEVDFSL